MYEKIIFICFISVLFSNCSNTRVLLDDRTGIIELSSSIVFPDCKTLLILIKLYSKKMKRGLIATSITLNLSIITFKIIIDLLFRKE